MTQAQMASELRVSPSYVNLIERNQRPVSAQLLLRFAQSFDVELADLAGEDDDKRRERLKAVFDDPLFQESDITREDIIELSEGNPVLADAIVTLYGAFQDRAASDTRSEAAPASEPVSSDHAGEIVRFASDYMEAHGHLFPELEAAAETLDTELRAEGGNLFDAVRERLRMRHGTDVRILPADVMTGFSRRYDRHRRRILISEVLTPANRVFQALFQLAILEQDEAIAKRLDAADAPNTPARRMLRSSLANTFAASVMMPLGPFTKHAPELGYDIELLAKRYGASFEQVCHRLLSLRENGRSRSGFFLFRTDRAGNISKRLGASEFAFLRDGGQCPRWNVFEAFHTPRRITTQFVKLPDNSVYFTAARVVKRVTGPYGGNEDHELVLVLGRRAEDANALAYAGEFDLEKEAARATPIGPNCHICERVDCVQRAYPPAQKRLVVDESRRPTAPYAFAMD